MPFITRYGTYFGLVPLQMGRVHFVSPADSYTVDGRSYSASNDNDGLSPERAIRTLTQALTNVTASAGEVIVLLEGTHAQTATVRVQKAGVTILGIRSSSDQDDNLRGVRAMGRKTVLSFVGAAAPGLSIEADNVEIAFVELRPAPGFSTVIFRNASPDGLYMHNFTINYTLGQPSLNTQGIDFAYRADVAGLAGTSMARLAGGGTGAPIAKATAYLANFAIIGGGAYGAGIVTATADVTVVNARFHNRVGTWASPFVVATGTGYIFIQASSWSCETLNGINTGVDGTFAGIIAGKVQIDECRWPALALPSRAVAGFAIGTCSLTENYIANVTGGALVTTSA